MAAGRFRTETVLRSVHHDRPRKPTVFPAARPASNPRIASHSTCFFRPLGHAPLHPPCVSTGLGFGATGFSLQGAGSDLGSKTHTMKNVIVLVQM